MMQHAQEIIHIFHDFTSFKDRERYFCSTGSFPETTNPSMDDRSYWSKEIGHNYLYKLS